MKKYSTKVRIRLVALAFAALLAGALPAPTAIAQAMPPASTTQLTQATIRALQEALNKEGVKVVVDGVLGESTRAAIRKYQTEHHLAVTGEPDKATLDKLGVKVAQGAQGPAPQAEATTGTPTMGPGMMGPGMMGPGAMIGQMGGGMMGHGMMGDTMGPGMMGAQSGSMGMMSMMPGLLYGMPSGEMTADRVTKIVDGLLAWHGNPRLQVGKVAAEGSEIIAEVVTRDGSPVQKLAFNRYPAFVRQVP